MNARRSAELAPIPFVFALGALAAHASLTRVPRRFAIDLAQPFPIVTAWGAAGSAAFALLGATIAVATFALVVAGVRHAKQPRSDDASTVALVAAVAIAVATAWPYAFSSDVYAYAAYGAMLRAGLDPYALVPAGVHGPIIDAARWQWGGVYPVCVYGPLSVAVGAGAVAAFSAHGVAATLTALRIVAGLAFLGSIGFVARIVRDRPARERTIVLYAYGLNPVVLWSVAEGHNDAWLLCAATGAAALARSRARSGAFLLGLTVLFKAPGAAFALALGADRRLRVTSETRYVALAAAAGVAVGAILWLPLMVPALAALGSHGTYQPTISLQGLIGPIPALALTMFAAGNGLVRLLRGRRDGYAWLGIGIAIGLPNGYPWYALWLVPFALAAGPGRPALALWSATISSVVRYLPDAAGTLTPLTTHIASVVANIPLAYALLELRPPGHKPSLVEMSGQRRKGGHRGVSPPRF